MSEYERGYKEGFEDGLPTDGYKKKYIDLQAKLTRQEAIVTAGIKWGDLYDQVDRYGVLFILDKYLDCKMEDASLASVDEFDALMIGLKVASVTLRAALEADAGEVS